MAEIQTQAVGHWSLFSEQCAVPPPGIAKAGEGRWRDFMEFVLKGVKKGRKGWVIVSDAYSKNVCVPSGIISSVLLLRKLWFKEVPICPECKLCNHNA